MTTMMRIVAVVLNPRLSFLPCCQKPRLFKSRPQFCGRPMDGNKTSPPASVWIKRSCSRSTRI